MPKDMRLKDLFMKHFIAKAFHWTPDVMERISADDLDALMFIETQINKKELRDIKKKNGK